VINRNNRLKKLMELHAPRRDCAQTKSACCRKPWTPLFDNGRRGRVLRGANNRPLKSLSGHAQGQAGAASARTCSGKRVDYSGRSVIVVAPT